MKKTGILLVMTAALVLGGCGKSGSNDQAQAAGTQETASADTAVQTTASADTAVQTTADADKAIQTTASADTEVPKISASSKLIDLTGLSTTIAYSEIFDMNVSPDAYMGKTVRLKGDFALYTNMDGDKYYYTCLVTDTTACCAQGLEFILKGDPSFEKYPEVGDEIVVEGTFATYEEDGATYATLLDAELLDA